MEKHQRSRDELERDLQEQIAFLKASADSYDAGFEGEAKRLAVSLRVLLHDTKRQISLLTQLDSKAISFFSSGFPASPTNEIAHTSLVSHLMSPGQAAKFAPFLDDIPMEAVGLCAFEQWWNEAVIIDTQRRPLSRADVVLTMADQDGGAHVDPKLDGAYAALSRHNSLEWMRGDRTGTSQMVGAEFATVRQIAHEVLKVLLPGYAKRPSNSGVVVRNVQLHVTRADSGGVNPAPPLVARRNHKPPEVASSPMPNEQLEKFNRVGRNELCPCNSGKKYKKCHGRLA